MRLLFLGLHQTCMRMIIVKGLLFTRVQKVSFFAFGVQPKTNDLSIMPREELIWIDHA